MDNSCKPLVQIIGIPGSQRSAVIEAELKNQNLNFTSNLGLIIPAHDYANEVFHNSRLSKLILKRKLTVGELGCALAHREACRRLVNSPTDFPYSIIFEDDANLMANIDLKLLGKALIDPNPRILLLGWTPEFTLVLSEQDQSLSKVVEVVVPPTGAFAYAINVAAARVIANTTKNFTAVSDWPIEIYSTVKFFALNEPITDWKFASRDSDIDKLDSRENHENTNVFRRIRAIANSIIGLFILKLFQNRSLSARQIIGCTFIRDLSFSLAKPSPTNSNFYALPKRFQSLARFFKVTG